jgi:branched-chain amino acid transport system ATP-binding protein
MSGQANAIEVRDLQGHYGPSHVLHGMNFNVPTGQVVTLLGRNGAGKTTTLRAIMGLLRKRTGSIVVNGTQTMGQPPEQIAPLGVAYCPEERGIFPSLNVRENLLLPPVLAPGGFSTEEVVALFPRLAERYKSPGTKLSGGEQQMLAIARILRTGCRILLLDEPTEGLAPVIVQQIGDVLQELKRRGYTVLLVEHHMSLVMSVSDHIVALNFGRKIAEGNPEHIQKHPDVIEAYLGAPANV